ncbi:ImmA/IrrE family metallo-endopeptidase [Vampirovibrio chlorellavorus]|uniref:ImmA/IrrE family metallo-endopeptidase n=1 Tax=Vampirovibrio chlorellavorus TaxID=758823 RepID=UPI0026EE9298|nr:ImmA/IrrE family metallo-endopeptidase [Vampirovibrio chlorellavorus]
MNPEIRKTISKFISECPVNIEALIRELGLELDPKAKLDEAIAGQIQKLEDGRYKISVNKDDHYFRRRFTMAHELGHYLYHQHLIGNGVDDDKMYRSTSAGDFYNTLIEQRHETEANKFAASVLMPKHLVLKSYYDNKKDINVVAKLWQVSPTALKIRLDLPQED